MVLDSHLFNPFPVQQISFTFFSPKRNFLTLKPSWHLAAISLRSLLVVMSVVMSSSSLLVVVSSSSLLVVLVLSLLVVSFFMLGLKKNFWILLQFPARCHDRKKESKLQIDRIWKTFRLFVYFNFDPWGISRKENVALICWELIVSSSFSYF